MVFESFKSIFDKLEAKVKADIAFINEIRSDVEKLVQPAPSDIESPNLERRANKGQSFKLSSGYTFDSIGEKLAKIASTQDIKQLCSTANSHYKESSISNSARTIPEQIKTIESDSKASVNALKKVKKETKTDSNNSSLVISDKNVTNKFIKRPKLSKQINKSILNRTVTDNQANKVEVKKKTETVKKPPLKQVTHEDIKKQKTTKKAVKSQSKNK